MRVLQFVAYLPSPATPGFNLASARAIQVLVALLHHAIRLGTESAPPTATPPSPGTGVHQTPIQAVWMVGQLANACGCTRNTASAALKELAILGWISKSRERRSGGDFGGFRYSILAPPTELTRDAADLYASRLAPIPDSASVGTMILRDCNRDETAGGASYGD